MRALLIAQASLAGVPIMTSDGVFGSYEVDIIQATS